MNPEYLKVITDSLVNGMLPVAATFLVTIISMFLNNLRQKIKTEKGYKALEALGKVAQEVVGNLNQTIVGDIKKARRKLKDSDVDELKEIALHEVRYISQNSVLNDAKFVVNDLTKYIEINIEDAVRKQRTNFNEDRTE